MKLMRPWRLLSLACLGILLAGCLAGHPVLWQDPAVDLVWPEKPEQPRIRFLRAFSGAGDLRREEQAGKVLRWLTGGANEDISMLAPYGVAADGEGRVWVADAGAGLVHAFDLARGRVEYLSAIGKEPLASPVGIAVDPEWKLLYIADSSLGKVLVADLRGELRGARQPAEGFGRPGGIALDLAGNLYVTDVIKGTIEIFSRAGDHLRTLGSAVVPGGKFNRPSNVWIDRQGRIFVSDSMNFRVEVLGPDGSSLGIIGALGDVPGTFARPRGVAVDSKGHIYVADAAFDNIQVFDSAGKLLLHFGGSGKGPGSFNLPAGLFIDGNDRLYVVDSYNRRVQVFQYLGGGD